MFQLVRLEDNSPWSPKFITFYRHSGGAVLQVHRGICAIFGLGLKIPETRVFAHRQSRCRIKWSPSRRGSLDVLYNCTTTVYTSQ